MASFEHVVKIIGGLKFAYPNFGEKFTPEQWAAMSQVYHRILADIPDAQLEAAALDYAGRGTFFPSAAELRQSAFALVNHDQLSAEEAWGQVRRAFQYGYNEITDERTQRAVKIMGWYNLCMSENEVADRAHFMKIYGSLAERDKRDGAMLPEVKRLLGQVAGRLALRAGR